jgi:hypothetical protein
MPYDYLAAIDEIERRYSPERIAASRGRLSATWDLQRPPDTIPFIFIGVPDNSGVDGNALSEVRYPWEEQLGYLLDGILHRAVVDDDYIPSLSPGCRQGLLPTAYGAREEFSSEHLWPVPLFESAEQAYELRHADFTRQGVAAEFLDLIRFYRRATGGRLPIQMPDMQGPLDQAGNMLGVERLMTEMYDHPAAVHHLLDHMTQDFITYMHLLEEASEGTLIPIHCMPTVWLPPGKGMALSEDLLAVISRRFYPEFARPYNERVADEFGGVVIHSCGSWDHNLAALSHTRGLLGVNFSLSETSLPRVADALSNQAVILVHNALVTCNGLRNYTAREYVDFVFDFVKERNLRAIVLLVPDEGMTLDECAEVAQIARERARWS